MDTAGPKIDCPRARSITLFVPLSGRAELWGSFADFLDRKTWPHARTRVILLDTSDNYKFAANVRRWMAYCDYHDVRYIAERVAPPGLADHDRRDQNTRRDVQIAMACIYQRLARSTDTEYVWTLEDDVLPPDDVVEWLLWSFGVDVASVAAPYASRFHAGFVAWGLDGRILTGGQGVAQIGGNGFGCTLLRRSVLRHAVFHHGGAAGDFDRNFYDWLGEYHGGKFRALVDWSCAARHVQRETGGPVMQVAKR